MKDMLSWLESHGDLCNVSGAEGALAAALQQELDPAASRLEKDPLGSLLLRAGAASTMVSACFDAPGYLVLLKEEGKTYLVPTAREVGEKENDLRVTTGGKSYPVYREGEGKSAPFYLKKKDLPLGTPLKDVSVFEIKDGYLCGKFAARYALVYLLASLAEKEITNTLFCAQGDTTAYGEYNACRRWGFTAAILLGVSPKGGDSPLAMVRDGRHFSAPALLEQAEKAGFTLATSASPLTKAQMCAGAGCKTLTLALPCENRDQKTERVSLAVLEKFEHALFRFFA